MKNHILCFLPSRTQISRVLLFMLVALTGLKSGAQQPMRLDELVLKGTHNSYACCGGTFFENSCPVMHNQPFEQMDDWNVWRLELDFSVKMVNGIPIFYIGHNGPNGNDDTWTENEDPNAMPWWGETLEQFLVKIKNSKSFQYRPIIIKFEKKAWGPTQYNDSSWIPIMETLLINIFSINGIFGPQAHQENGGWKTVPEMAGQIIPSVEGPGSISTNLLFQTEPFTSWGVNDGKYTCETEYISKCSSKDFQIIAADQYQDEWTFNQFLAPPNPIYIKGSALILKPVINIYGSDCGGGACYPDGDPHDKGKFFFVSQHGTFRFPFNQIGESYTIAKPGWTLLIHTGNYPEKNLTFTKALTLKADGGPVVIGQ